MASVDFNGIDAQLQRMSRLGQNITPAAKKATKAGAAATWCSSTRSPPAATASTAKPFGRPLTC